MATVDVDDDRALLERVERLVARSLDSSSDDEDEKEEEQQERESSATASSDAPDKQLRMEVNPEEEVEPPSFSGDAGTAREKSLQRKLARTLMELADARDNAQLAARAGNALLEKLARVEGDAQALRDELEMTTRENTRLQRVVSAMEEQLRRFELVETPTRRRSEQPPTSSWRSAASFIPVRVDDACRECEERVQDARTARQERDQLRRQCLELELQVQNAHHTESDLRRELERANDRARRLQSDLVATSSDRDGFSERYQALQQENVRLTGVRETLRATVRALRADKRLLSDRLGESEQQVASLERDKRELATRVQIADNRRVRAEKDSEHLLHTLDDLNQARQSEQKQVDDQRLSIEDECSERGEEERRRRKVASNWDNEEESANTTTVAELLRLDSGELDSPETSSAALHIDTSGEMDSSPPLLPAPVVRARPQRAQWALSLTQGASPLFVEAPTTSSSPVTPPETPSAVAARRAVVMKRLSGVDHYCIVGSSAGVNGPDIRLLEAQTQQQHRGEISAGSSDHIGRSPEAKSDTLAPPPSPMYLGLSLLVACATAAGIAARR